MRAFSNVILRGPNSFGRRRISEILRGACPEHYEILRYAQNDKKQRAQNDKGRMVQKRLFKNVVAQFIGQTMPDESGNYKNLEAQYLDFELTTKLIIHLSLALRLK